MSKTRKHSITEDDYIKAVRKADRDLEIERHGKIVSMYPSRTHKTRKAYNRAKERNNRISDEE